MPDEQWRDELQEYALLVEAVASGDRSKVVKLFGDYILRKKAEEEEAAAEQEDNGEQYDENGDDLDPDGEYGEEYNAEEYDTYYDEHETGEEEYNPPAQKKRVRFAEEEEEEEGEYFDEEGNLAYGSQDYEYNGEEDEFYGQDYNQDEYDEGVDGGPYMSGALPSENHDQNTYYQDDYGDGYGNYDGPGSYGQEDQLHDSMYSHDPEHQVQYRDYYGSSAGANGYGELGYYDSTQDDPVYDYNTNQQNGGEWNKALHENERVTDDEVQDYGFNNDAGERGQPYPEDTTMPQEIELNALLNRLQQETEDHEFDKTYIDEAGDDFPAGHYYEQDNVGDEADEYGLGGESQTGDYSGSAHMYSNPDEAGNTFQQALDPEEEASVYDDDDDDDFDFWDEDPADEANIQGYSEDLSQLRQQFWADDADTDDLHRGSMDPYNEGFEDDDEEDESWGNPVRPHYDDAIPFPSFHRTISNDQVLPYAIIPGDRFDESIDRDPMKEVNPQYNVFDAGQRFYDHYSGSCEDTKADTRKSSNQRGNLHPMSLVDRFRERLYAN